MDVFKFNVVLCFTTDCTLISALSLVFLLLDYQLYSCM